VGIYLFTGNLRNRLTGNNCSNGYQGIVIQSSNSNTATDNTCNSNDEDGIFIAESSLCVLRNNSCMLNDEGVQLVVSSGHNTLDGNTLCDNKHGVLVKNSDNNTLENNRCSANEYGMYIEDSGNNTLFANNCSANVYGIYVDGSYYTITEENDCTGNDADGVCLDYSGNVIIKGNNCSGNKGGGLYSNHAGSTTIEGNTFNENDEAGIRIDTGEFVNITDNNCSSNLNEGVLVDSSSSTRIEDNTISGNSDEGIEVLNSEDIHIRDNTVQDNKDSENFNGIYLSFSNNCELDNNTISGSGVDGIVLEDSDHNILSRNVARSNGDDGVSLVSSHNNTLQDNNCSENSKQGITLHNSNDNKLLNNSCTANVDEGILLESSSSIHIENSTVAGNTNDGIGIHDSNRIYIRNNTISSMIVDEGYDGVALLFSANCHVANNTIIEGDFDGIRLYGSDHNTLVGNVIHSCGIDGIGLEESYNNSIENNTVHSNEEYGIGLFTAWNNSVRGNTIFANRGGICLRNNSRDNTAHSNSIYGNEEYGINAANNNGSAINATDNWWGHVSGPYHATENPDGKGDNVTDDVVFDPWIKDPPPRDYSVPVAIIDSLAPSPALEEQEVEFSGDGTAYGSIVLYAWTSDLHGELYNGTARIYTGEDLNLGTHNITLRVQDNYGVWSDGVSTTLIVHERPIAYIDSISPDPASDTDLISFNATATDDGTIERYAWSSDLDGELHNGTQANFTSSGLRAGIHNITLRARDNHGIWSAVVNTTLLVTGRPTAIITSISPDPALEGENVHFSGNGTDDGKLTLYAWRSSLDGELYNGTSPGFDDDTLSNGTHTISFGVKDDSGIWSAEVTTTLTVNGRPRAKIDGIHPIKAVPGDTIRFYGNGTDDGTIAGYEWWSDIDGWLGDGPSFSLSNLSLGNHTISFRVRNDLGVWSLETVAETQVVVEEPGFKGAGIRVNLTSGKTERVAITGTNVTLEITTTIDLLDELIHIEEATNNTDLNTTPLGQGPYIDIQVSKNISNALESALIKVYYSEDALPNNVNEPSLRLFYWNDTNRGWEPIAVCGINTEENYVVAEVSHFSVYGVGEFNFPPMADAGKRKEAGPEEEVQFSGSGTDHFNRNLIVLYEWDFDGDGIYDWSSTTMGTTTCSYTSPGTYYAKLRVTDDGGGRGFDTVEVVVEEEEDDIIPGFGLATLIAGLLMALGIARFPKGGRREKQGPMVLLLTLLILMAGSIMPLSQMTKASPGDDASCDTTIIDISSSNYRPTEGEKVTIRANVFNEGTIDAYTTVWFGYLGNFSAIGEDYTFTEPDGIGVAQVELDTSELEGEKTIFVIIKNSEPAESNLSNNVGAATITLDIQPAEENEETPLWETPQAVLAGIVCVGLLLLYTVKRKKKSFQMDDVFLVYKDGRLILHETTRLRPDFDAMIIGGMLTAVQKFVMDSFWKDEKEGKLKQLRYEDHHILLEKGDYVFCCVSLTTTGDIPKKVRKWLKEAIVRIEDEFHDVLKSWNGSINDLRGAKEIIKEEVIVREKK